MIGFDFIQDLALVMLIAAAAAWVCQRMGVPGVVGYITAGILIGPLAGPHALVSDSGRIQSLAQIGLVFLIFNIGQRVRLQRLKRVGLPLILATAGMAALVLVGCRALGATLGWPAMHSLVLAGMLMVSSTAVLSKSLRQANATHSGFGQTALTVTTLDDLVAVGMLTVLASVAQAGQTGALLVFGSIIQLKAVMVTMAIGGLLLVPSVLKRLGRGVASEVRSLVAVGLLLAMALLSARAGFSAALGAFLLGSIMSSTDRIGPVERVLEGICEVLAPVFFVAMGMLFEFKALATTWPLLLGVFGLAVVWRAVAATAALLLAGQPIKEASRAAMCLTPIGEFSLIIALTGVQGGLVPASFYGLAIGVCLLTALTTPMLIRKSEALSEYLEQKQPEFLRQGIGFYHEWIERLKHRRQSSLLWKLAAPQLVQMTCLILFVSGLVIFAKPLYRLAEKWLGTDWPAAGGLPGVFWFGFGLLLLGPLLALWRNVETVALLCAEAAAAGRSKRAEAQFFFERLVKGAALVAILVWLAALFPYGTLPAWEVAGLTAAFLLVGAVFWRKLIRLHNRFEMELRTQLVDSPFAEANGSWAGWPKGNGEGKLNLAESVIGEHTRAVARAISELPLRPLFSCTIASIERQGIVIPNPGAATILYPNDKVLLLGRNEDLRRADRWLSQEAEGAEAAHREPQLSDLSLQRLTVPAVSRHIGKALGELPLKALFGIQIVGIERDQQLVVSPGRSEALHAGDQLLILGAPEQVNELAFWLST